MTKTELTTKPISASQMLDNINETLPEIVQKSHFFRRDTQASMSLQTLTMLNGRSPYRMLRQAAAEIDQRRNALLESYLNVEKLQKKIDKADGMRQEIHSLQMVELQNNIQNAVKDIALFTERYKQIEKKHGIADWDEADFEREEAKHHVRRGFELLYQNLLQTGRPEKAIIEYLQQYGVHPQIANLEVSGYIQMVQNMVHEAKGKIEMGADHLEDFLDQMRDKYAENPSKVAERIFGEKDMVVRKAIAPSIEREKTSEYQGLISP